MNLGERDAFVRGFFLAVKLMIEAMSREQNWRALFRPVLREENIRSRTRENQIKPTQAICRGVWAKKAQARSPDGFWSLCFFDRVAVLSYVFCVTTKSRVKRLYSTLHNHKMQEYF